MSASVPGAAPAAASTTVLGEVEAWFLKVMHAAQNLWAKAKAAETDATAYVATHPEVVAVADTLEAMAPPAVQTAINAGLSVAEEG